MCAACGLRPTPAAPMRAAARARAMRDASEHLDLMVVVGRQYLCEASPARHHHVCKWCGSGKTLFPRTHTNVPPIQYRIGQPSKRKGMRFLRQRRPSSSRRLQALPLPALLPPMMRCLPPSLPVYLHLRGSAVSAVSALLRLRRCWERARFT